MGGSFDRAFHRPRCSDHRGCIPGAPSTLRLTGAMRGVRWLSGIWRGASFSLKFAAVILVAGVALAVVPLMLAEASARAQAESSAADSVSIAANLIDGQRASLDASSPESAARSPPTATWLSRPRWRRRSRGNVGDRHRRPARGRAARRRCHRRAGNEPDCAASVTPIVSAVSARPRPRWRRGGTRGSWPPRPSREPPRRCSLPDR